MFFFFSLLGEWGSGGKWGGGDLRCQNTSECTVSSTVWVFTLPTPPKKKELMGETEKGRKIKEWVRLLNCPHSPPPPPPAPPAPATGPPVTPSGSCQWPSVSDQTPPCRPNTLPPLKSLIVRPQTQKTSLATVKDFNSFTERE